MASSCSAVPIPMTTPRFAGPVVSREKFKRGDQLPSGLDSAGQQDRLLKDGADFRTRAEHNFTVECDPAFGGLHKPRNHHKQCALAATAWTYQADEFAINDLNRDVPDCLSLLESLRTASTRSKVDLASVTGPCSFIAPRPLVLSLPKKGKVAFDRHVDNTNATTKRMRCCPFC
jgi:hypothetical protein